MKINKTIEIEFEKRVGKGRITVRLNKDGMVSATGYLSSFDSKSVEDQRKFLEIVAKEMPVVINKILDANLKYVEEEKKWYQF